MAEQTPSTDKTGAAVTVTRVDAEFTVAVEGKTVGLMKFLDHDAQRVFFHTEVESAFEGHGLATILIAKGLAATRADGMRIVAVCPMVSAYVKKHHDYDDLVDRPTREILALLR